MSYLFFSIIIPVYNDKPGLRKLLDSLFYLNYPQSRFEIVVVDNNSTDNPAEVCSSYPDIRLVKEYKQGVCAARNRGIKEARGDVLAFIDSDCLADCQWIFEANKMLQNNKISAIGGRVEMYFRDVKPDLVEYLDTIRFLDQKSYVAEGYAATANFFIYRDVQQEIGFFNDYFEWGEDYEFTRRLATQGYRLEYSPEAVVYHRARTDFASLLKKSKRIAYSQKLLRQEGLRHEQSSFFRLCLPRKTIPHKYEYLKNFTFWQKILIFLGFNLLHYHSIFYRYL